MLISEDLLFSYGAEIRNYDKGEIIFSEKDSPKNYFQLVSGRIKLNHYNEEGKEMILAILHKGLSVCELLLFIDEKYPVNAITLEKSSVIKLSKSAFMKLVNEHHNVSLDINRFLSQRLYYKFIMLENNSSLHPEVRIKGVMDYHKSFFTDQDPFSFQMPLTRQQLAAMTGLRVETVIRTIKNLEQQQTVKIESGKIYY